MYWYEKGLPKLLFGEHCARAWPGRTYYKAISSHCQRELSSYTTPLFCPSLWHYFPILRKGHGDENRPRCTTSVFCIVEILQWEQTMKLQHFAEAEKNHFEVPISGHKPRYIIPSHSAVRKNRYVKISSKNSTLLSGEFLFRHFRLRLVSSSVIL